MNAQINPNYTVDIAPTSEAKRRVGRAIAIATGLIAALFFVSPGTAKAVVCTSTGTGNWNTTGTWDCGHVPAAADDVVIAATHSVSLDVVTNSLASLTINGTLTSGGGTLNVAGSANVGGTGTLNISSGTYNVGTAAAINDLVYATGSTITISGGALNVTGGLHGVAGTDTTTYSQSAGTVTLDIVDVSGAFAAFDIRSAGSSFSMSGGTIIQQNPTNSANGDYTNLAAAGTVTGGTLQFGNVSTTIANPYAIQSSAPVFNLTVVGTVSPLTELIAPLTVNGSVNIQAGATLDTLSLDMSVAGDWTNAGTFTSGVDTVTFNGASAQTISGSAVTVFSGLTINNSGSGVTLTSNETVSGALTLSTDLRVSSPAVLTESGTSSGTGDVIGSVRRADLTTTAKAFGNPNVQVTRVVGTITTLTINLDKQSPQDFANAVRRIYTLTPGAGTLGNATVRLHYLDAELNGNAEGATLHLWRRAGSWADQGQTSNDSTANWVELTGVTAFSPWTIASPTGPTAVKLTRFSAASFSDGVELSWESGYEVNNLGYHLYREQNGMRTRVTPSLVAGSALTVGPENHLTAGYGYGWFDPRGTPETLYYLEAVDLNGERAMVGPIYPAFAGGSSKLFAKRQRATLVSELGSSSAGGSGQPFEQSWPAAMKESARTTTLRFSAETLTTQQAIAAGKAVKIQVRGTGWYHVGQAELVAAGLDPAVDAHLLQLYVDGEEQPIRVSGDGSRLGASDGIEFYGVGLDTPTTDTHVYYLITGDVPGKRIVSRRTKSRLADQNWTDNFGSSFAYTAERREKVIYLSNLLNGDADNIFGPPVTSDPVTQMLTVSNFDREAAGQARIEVALQGLTAKSHQVQVQLNGFNLGTISFTGREHPVATFPVDRTLLQDGGNAISLVAANGDSDVSFVDWVRLTYAHQYRADNNELRFSVPGGQAVRVDGFARRDISVFDVTNPNSVTEVAASLASSGAGYAVKLKTTGAETRTFIAFTNDLVKQAAAITANQPSSWSASSNAADLVIIAPKDFRQTIEPLANLRRSQGLAVAVVDVEDVYDEFSYGAHTPTALKGFLSLASRWRRAPQYLLLVGDSSWDPRNYLDQGYNDFMPTKLIDTANMETASDDWLADFDGDGVAEMAVGRLPGRTAEQISLMVSKILAYEQERQLGEPQKGALLVADRGFEAQSGQTRTLLPADLTVQMINRLEVGNDDTVRSQIVEAIDRGPLVVNYYGHGSVSVWTGAGLLNSTSAANLTNGNRLSLFVMMTCLNGYAHDAFIDSLGEALLKAEQGGAVAVWASSGFTQPGPQFTMASAFYQNLFGPGSPRLGEAIRSAKAATFDNDVRRTWILLGDPTMRLR